MDPSRLRFAKRGRAQYEERVCVCSMGGSNWSRELEPCVADRSGEGLVWVHFTTRIRAEVNGTLSKLVGESEDGGSRDGIASVGFHCSTSPGLGSPPRGRNVQLLNLSVSLPGGCEDCVPMSTVAGTRTPSQLRMNVQPQQALDNSDTAVINHIQDGTRPQAGHSAISDPVQIHACQWDVFC